MWGKFLTISLALVMIVSFTSCAKEPSAQEIINNVIEAQDDIRAYEFEMDMSLDATGEINGETIELTIGVANYVALDLDNRNMRMVETVNCAIPGEDTIGKTVEGYCVDNMVYAMSTEMGQEPEWEKEELSEPDWQQMAQHTFFFDHQIELLQTAEVKVLEPEKLEGVDCYVLQLFPGVAQLWQTIMQQTLLGAVGLPVSEELEAALKETASNFTVKQWVAKDTHFLMKEEIDMAIELPFEALGLFVVSLGLFPEKLVFIGGEEQMTTDITLSCLINNYNKSISIELPPGLSELSKPSPPSSSTQESPTTSQPQIIEPSEEVKNRDLPTSPSPSNFDDVRHVMNAVEDFAMTAVLSLEQDKYTLSFVISNGGMETDVSITESTLSSKLGSQFKLVLLGQEAYVQPKTLNFLGSSFLKSGAINLDDTPWIRIDLSENWPVTASGSYLSWDVPLLFTQVRAERHRPLLFDPRIPLDFFDISVQGQESRDGFQLTHFLVQADWIDLCHWLIDSEYLTRASDGTIDRWNSEVELWVDEENLVRQMKVSQSTLLPKVPVYSVVWIHEPSGSVGYGCAPYLPVQDVVIDFRYDDIPDVVPPTSDAVILTKDMVRNF